MAAGRIEVHGLKELRRDLKALDAEGSYKAELRDAGKKAAEVVAEETRQRARRGATTIAGTHASMGGAAIGSIRSLAGQTRATVALGKASIPYAGGWEFGSGGAHRQFPRKKQDGYNLYPAIKDKRNEVIEVYSREIGHLLKRYDLD